MNEDAGAEGRETAELSCQGSVPESKSVLAQGKSGFSGKNKLAP